MYLELGGYVGYSLTPLREVQEVRTAIVAEMTVAAERANEERARQEEEARRAPPARSR